MELMNKRACTTTKKDDACDMPGALSDAYCELLPRQAGIGKDFPIKPKTFPNTTAGSSKRDVLPPKDRCCFRVAIICTLPLEFNAIRSLFDFTWQEQHHHCRKVKGDTNHYVNVRIGDLDVVVLPLSSTGNVSAATAVANLEYSYTELEVVFLAGICGGIPEVRPSNSGKREVLLGDVVVSSNMVQYDFGRRYQDNFVTKPPVHTAKKPINNFLIHLKTDIFLDNLTERSAEVLEQMQLSNPDYQYPGSASDRLYERTYQHQQGDICKAQKPLIFLERFGSGDTVLKSSQDRNKLAELLGIAAFEMESAGLWEDLPCIVVKGVCDYADSHKNKEWQNFAAATSASVVKALLERTGRKTTVLPYRSELVNRNASVISVVLTITLTLLQHERHKLRNGPMMALDAMTHGLSSKLYILAVHPSFMEEEHGRSGTSVANTLAMRGICQSNPLRFIRTSDESSLKGPDR
ncbi:hypothetical protein FGADI_9068 [Fusarium gaditjirri]|uniref:Nucleoside phosphorylase domain-containing protein n=1 Tax=Fusarium gaditjirri TaxID=282569 RepID=A0A8H4T0Q7_9HYPO|nr:hypothetical protein FGADI_9068 [Fusarium gaditjirri]